MNPLELKLCDVQGRLFELFLKTEYDPESIVSAFMNGAVAKYLDSSYNRMQWAGEEYLLEEIIDTYKDKLKPKQKEYSIDVLYWMGYVYRYWHYYTAEDSKKIFKQAPFKTMNRNFYMFHTMGVELAIEDLKEIYRQKKKHNTLDK